MKSHWFDGDDSHGEHGHGRLGKARTRKEWKFLSFEKGRVSESDSLQLRIPGGIPMGILDSWSWSSSEEKPDSNVEMFNLVFTPVR